MLVSLIDFLVASKEAFIVGFNFLIFFGKQKLARFMASYLVCELPLQSVILLVVLQSSFSDVDEGHYFTQTPEEKILLGTTESIFSMYKNL